MSKAAKTELTALINQMLHGDNAAATRALARLLPSLRLEARRRLKKERRGYDLETDVLVETAVRRVIRPENPVQVNDRDHFMNLSKLQMNRKLAERGRLAERHRDETEVKDHHAAVTSESALVAKGTLAGALERLRELDPERYGILVQRELHGASWREVAEQFGLSEATVKYRYQAAYAWLSTKLGGPER
jgi:DNA-directed RNA polymerase specialized sigma24 family protein